MSYIGGICVHPDHSYILAVDYGTPQLWQINIPSGGNVNSFVNYAWAGPIDCDIDHQGQYAYVTDSLSNRLYQINLSNKSVLAFDVGNQLNIPIGIVIDHNSTYAYVTNQGSKHILRVTLSNGTVSSPIDQSGPAFQLLWGITLDSTGIYLYCTDYGTNHLYRVDVNTGVATIFDVNGINNPRMVTLDGSQSTAYYGSTNGKPMLRLLFQYRNDSFSHCCICCFACIYINISMCRPHFYGLFNW